MKNYRIYLFSFIIALTAISCDEDQPVNTESEEFITEVTPFNAESFNDDLLNMERQLERDYGIRFIYSGSTFRRIELPDPDSPKINTWFKKNNMYNDAYVYSLNYQIVKARQNQIKGINRNLYLTLASKTQTMGQIIIRDWLSFLEESLSNLNSRLNDFRIVEILKFKNLSLNIVVTPVQNLMPTQRLRRLSRRAVKICEGLVTLKADFALETLGFSSSNDVASCSERIKVEFLASLYDELSQGQPADRAVLNAIDHKISAWDQLANDYLYANSIILNPIAENGFDAFEIQKLKRTVVQENPGLNNSMINRIVYNNMFENLTFKLSLVEARINYLSEHPDNNNQDNRNAQRLIRRVFGFLPPYNENIQRRGGTSPFDADSPFFN